MKSVSHFDRKKKKKKWKSYNAWLLSYREQDIFFLSFWVIFFPFNPLKPEKIIFWKRNKTPGDIIISHMCTINGNHMKYGSWDMEHDKEFFVILGHCLIFYTSNNPKNQNFEKMKKTPEDIILHLCTTNHDHMMYGSWDKECDRLNFLSLLTRFCTITC